MSSRTTRPGLGPVLLGALVAGLVLGPALDQIHVVGGALSYADPVLFDQAWWVAPQFALAFALILGTTVAWELRAPTDRAAAAPNVVLLQLGWFLAAYVTTGAGWERPWVVVALLAAGLALRAPIDRPDRRMLAIALVLAVGGTAYEAALSSIPGTFDYEVTAGLPVPPWLPLLYVHAAPLVRTTSLAIARGLSRRAPLP